MPWMAVAAANVTRSGLDDELGSLAFRTIVRRFLRHRSGEALHVPALRARPSEGAHLLKVGDLPETVVCALADRFKQCLYPL
jgi:hypothetical protein